MPRQCIRVLNRHAGSETWIERLREARAIMKRIGVHDYLKVERTLEELGALTKR